MIKRTLSIFLALVFMFSFIFTSSVMADENRYPFFKSFVTPVKSWFGGFGINHAIETSDECVLLVGSIKGAEAYVDFPAVAKVDKYGKTIWAKMFELNKQLSDSRNYFTKVIELSNGSYLVVGYSKSSFNTSNSIEEIIALNILPNGQVKWFKAFGKKSANEQIWPNSIVENDDETVSISGIIRIADQNITCGFLIDIDQNGNILSDFVLDAAGYYVNKEFYKLTHGYMFITNQFYESLWLSTLRRYDINKSLLWSRAFYIYDPESKKNLPVQDVKFVEVEDGIICVGNTGWKMPFIFKIDDKTGSIIWSKFVSKIDSGIAERIFASPDNGAYITFTNGYSTIGMSVLKISTKGEIKWLKNYGGTYISTVISTDENNLLYAGSNFVSLVDSNGNANFINKDNQSKIFTGFSQNLEIGRVEVKTLNGAGQGSTDYKFAKLESMDISKYFIVKTDFSDNIFVSMKPIIKIDKPSINFGTVKVNSSQMAGVYVINEGLSDLQIIKMSLSGTNKNEFQIKNDFKVIKANQKQLLNVVVLPKTPGSKKAIINLETNDPENKNVQIQLVCNAINPAGRINVNPSYVNFGTVSVGGKYTKAVTVTNTGVANLKITSVSINGNDVDEFSFEVSKIKNKILKPKQKVTFNVICKPTSKGTKSAYIIINSNDANGKTKISLSAKAN